MHIFDVLLLFFMFVIVSSVLSSKIITSALLFFMLFSNAQIVSKSCAVFWQYYILCSWRADLHLFNVVYDFYKLLDLRASGA